MHLDKFYINFATDFHSNLLVQIMYKKFTQLS